MYIFTLALLILVSPHLPASSIYYPYEKSAGDLNNDNHPDQVIASAECKDAQACATWVKDTSPKTILSVLFFNPTSKKLETFIKSDKMICYHCGGMKGDIFSGNPSITKGILNITYSGGSRYIWNHVFKWRLGKDNKFKLIGSTITNADTASEDPNKAAAGDITMEDINFSTGKAEVTFITKAHKIQKVLCSFDKNLKTPKFGDFNFEDFDTDIFIKECREQIKK